MQSYKITLPNYDPFTMITTTPPEEVPAAVFERFRVEAVEVVALVQPAKITLQPKLTRV
jgi:hypothetical protein